MDSVTIATPADEIRRGVAYLKSRMARPVTLDGISRLAIAETAERFRDSRWYWTDDNAKALELLALPGIWNDDPAFGEAILDFVLAMSPGDTIRRRLAEPHLQVVDADPKAFRVVTAFHELTGDLSQGVVQQAIRFNDGRGRVAVAHTGNLVEFRLGLRRHCLDVEAAITAFGITRTGDGVTLFHDSRLVVPGRLGQARRPVGTIRYAYEASAGHPCLALRVTLRADPGVTLRDVRITTACDALSGMPRVVTLGTGNCWRAVPLPAGTNVKLHCGPLDHMVLQDAGPVGHAHALHIRPADPDRLLNVTATMHADGLPHWMLTRYATPRVAAGDSFSVSESRLLLSGGRLPGLADAAAMMHVAAASDGIDPSASYDHGAELNAVASLLLHASTDAYAIPLPAARQTALVDWFDRHLDGFFAALAPAGAPDGCAVYVRGLAFVVMALDAMRRATGQPRYAVRLGAALDLLLQAQQVGANDGLFRDTGAGVVFLDCHAAAILALARLLQEGGGDARVAPALRRALGALRMGTIPTMNGGVGIPYDTIVVRSQASDGSWTEDGAFWTYKAALLLRAFRAVQTAAASGTLPLDATERARVDSLMRFCEVRVGETMRIRPEATEHLTSPFAGETNSETQAWVLLALAESVRPARGRELTGR